MPNAQSDGMKFMIVEDEVLVALDLADMLSDLGHEVVFTESDVGRAIKIAEVETIDIAIMDINLRGELSFPVAKILRDRGVPVIFSSGYGRKGLIEDFQDAHFLTKPFGLDALATAVAKVRSTWLGQVV
jgi:CheY-like chemotaxis protein